MPLHPIPLTRIPLPRIALPRTPLTLGAAARRWSTASQTHARRNAMVALTSLSERRAEREDADAYLASAARRRGLTVAVPRRSDETDDDVTQTRAR